MLPLVATATTSTMLGDVNGDGSVNISDVTSLIDHLLGSDGGEFNAVNADVDKDGNITISDVTMLIDALLGSVDLNPPVTETFTVNGVTFKMIAVEGGVFMMGAADDDTEALSGEKPAHQVTLSSYCFGEIEVTQELWLAVMGNNPSWFSSENGFTEDLQRPVECVRWIDCMTFISKLNELTGRQFRLPTEAEWEFAARGGNNSNGYKYAGSNTLDDVAWYYGNCYSEENSSLDFATHTVATKSPNELGLYDMSGNVWEWCQDLYGSYSSEAQTNPTGVDPEELGEEATEYVLRGGSRYDEATTCRVTYRSYNNMMNCDGIFGLRLAL